MNTTVSIRLRVHEIIPLFFVIGTTALMIKICIMKTVSE